MTNDRLKDQLPNAASQNPHTGDSMHSAGIGEHDRVFTNQTNHQNGLGLSNVAGVEAAGATATTGHDHNSLPQEPPTSHQKVEDERYGADALPDVYKSALGEDYSSKTGSDEKGIDQPQRVSAILNSMPDVYEDPPPKPSTPKRILNFIRSQWFLLTMGFLIVIASQTQVPEKHQEQKSKLVGYITVSVIFFLTGCTLPTKSLIQTSGRWKVHLWVQIGCFFITSLLMFAIVTIAALKEKFMDPGLLCGMVLTGCIATTISSNIVMTTQAHGSTALTVTESTLGNIIGVFLTPALFKAYTSTGSWYTKVLPAEPGGSAELYRRVFKQLGLSVFIPLFAGQIVHNVLPNLTKTVCGKYKVSKLGSVALLIIIWSTYDSAFASGALHSVSGHNIAFVVFMSIILFFLFLAVTFVASKKWLDRPDTVACCYCIPAKSPAIGIPISTILFTGMSPMLQAKLQLPLVLYQGLQILAGTILTRPFAEWVDREERRKEERRRLTGA